MREREREREKTRHSQNRMYKKNMHIRKKKCQEIEEEQNQMRLEK